MLPYIIDRDRNLIRKGLQMPPRPRPPTLSRPDIALALSSLLKLPRSQGRRVLDAVVAVIKQKVAAGHRVELRGFATLQRKLVRSRKARNPLTGEAVQTVDHYVVKATASPRFLKDHKKKGSK